jgi:hypothetical protein
MEQGYNSGRNRRTISAKQRARPHVGQGSRTTALFWKDTLVQSPSSRPSKLPSFQLSASSLCFFLPSSYLASFKKSIVTSPRFVSSQSSSQSPLSRFSFPKISLTQLLSSLYLQVLLSRDPSSPASVFPPSLFPSCPPRSSLLTSLFFRYLYSPHSLLSASRFLSFPFSPSLFQTCLPLRLSSLRICSQVLLSHFLATGYLPGSLCSLFRRIQIHKVRCPSSQLHRDKFHNFQEFLPASFPFSILNFSASHLSTHAPMSALPLIYQTLTHSPCSTPLSSIPYPKPPLDASFILQAISS